MLDKSPSFSLFNRGDATCVRYIQTDHDYKVERFNDIEKLSEMIYGILNDKGVFNQVILFKERRCTRGRSNHLALVTRK